jgi:hypothetical protein
MAGKLWRKAMATRLQQPTNVLTVRQMEAIASAASSVPPAQRNAFFVFCGRVLQVKARERTITDVDVSRAIRDGLAQAGSAAGAVARG